MPAPHGVDLLELVELTRLKAIVSNASRYGYLPANFPSLEQLLLSPVTNLFLPPPDIIRSMYYTNCCADMGLHYPTCNLVIYAEKLSEPYVVQL